MNKDQILSIVRGILKAAGGAAVAKGIGDASGWEGFIGVVTALIGFVTSHSFHSDNSQAKRANGTIGFAPMLLLAALMIPFVACKTQLAPGGAYAPAVITLSTNASGIVSTNVVATAAPDLGLFVVDSAFDLAYSTARTVFQTEKDNRALLWKLSPKIKKALDQARPIALDVRNRYIRARIEYRKNPTPAGLDTLHTILSEMQNVANGAQAVMPNFNSMAGTTNAVPAVKPN